MHRSVDFAIHLAVSILLPNSLHTMPKRVLIGLGYDTSNQIYKCIAILVSSLNSFKIQHFNCYQIIVWLHTHLYVNLDSASIQKVHLTKMAVPLLTNNKIVISIVLTILVVALSLNKYVNEGITPKLNLQIE